VRRHEAFVVVGHVPLPFLAAGWQPSKGGVHPWTATTATRFRGAANSTLSSIRKGELANQRRRRAEKRRMRRAAVSHPTGDSRYKVPL
jgi:hypothetical protein